MLIDVNKWIDKNGSFDEAGGLDLVRYVCHSIDIRDLVILKEEEL